LGSDAPIPSRGPHCRGGLELFVAATVPQPPRFCQGERGQCLTSLDLGTDGIHVGVLDRGGRAVGDIDEFASFSNMYNNFSS